jgi:hypothetical protein
MKSNKTVFYQVREISNEDEFDYYIVPAEQNGEENYDPSSLESALEYTALNSSTWVVKITEEVI